MYQSEHLSFPLPNSAVPVAMRPGIKTIRLLYIYLYQSTSSPFCFLSAPRTAVFSNSAYKTTQKRNWSVELLGNAENYCKQMS